MRSCRPVSAAASRRAGVGDLVDGAVAVAEREQLAVERCRHALGEREVRRC